MNDTDREPLELPEGYYAQIDGPDVRIFRKGHVGESEDSPELLFQSNTIHHRRPTTWLCGNLSDDEGRVLQKVLFDGWGWKVVLV